MTLKFLLSIALVIVITVFQQAVYYQENAKEQSTPDNSEREILAKKSANPLSDLWILVLQNDTSTLKGDLTDDDTKVLNSFKFQPVMPIPLFGGEYNFIIRPVFQLNSVPLDKDVGRLIGTNLDSIIDNEKFSSSISTSRTQDSNTLSESRTRPFITLLTRKTLTPMPPLFSRARRLTTLFSGLLQFRTT